METAIITRETVDYTPKPVTESWMDEFFQFNDIKALSARTYGEGLKDLFKYLKAHGITQPTRVTLIDWKKDMEARGLEAATRHTYIIAARNFFKWTASARLYPNVAEGVKGPTVSKYHKRDALTAGQVKETLARIDRSTLKGKRDYAILTLMVTGGARIVEIMRANIEDLATTAGDVVLYVQGKDRDDKAEFLRIVPEVEAAIRDYLAARGERDPAAPLFASLDHRHQGARLTRRSVSRIAKERMIEAGIITHRLTAHSFRHTAVTLAIEGGCSITDARQFARHSSIKTTMIYYHEHSNHTNPCAGTVASRIF